MDDLCGSAVSTTWLFGQNWNVVSGNIGNVARFILNKLKTIWLKSDVKYVSSYRRPLLKARGSLCCAACPWRHSDDVIDARQTTQWTNVFFNLRSACLKHRHADVQIDCRQKHRIIHCEQIKRNLIKLGLKIRELLAIIYTVCLSRPVNVAAVQNCWCDVVNVVAVQNCWCDVTISKWRQQQETRAKRMLYKRVLQTKQMMRPKIEYRGRRN